MTDPRERVHCGQDDPTGPTCVFLQDASGSSVRSHEIGCDFGPPLGVEFAPHSLLLPKVSVTLPSACVCELCESASLSLKARRQRHVLSAKCCTSNNSCSRAHHRLRLLLLLPVATFACGDLLHVRAKEQRKGDF